MSASRSAGARVAIDRSIRSTLRRCHPLDRPAFLRIIDTLRRRTSLLKPHRLSVEPSASLSIDSTLDAAVRLSDHERHWARPPETFRGGPGERSRMTRPGTDWCEFLEHMIETYPVPPVMRSAWHHRNGNPCWRQLHVHLGRGRSIRSFAMPGGWLMNKHAAKAFMVTDRTDGLRRTSIDRMIRRCQMIGVLWEQSRGDDAFRAEVIVDQVNRRHRWAAVLDAVAATLPITDDDAIETFFDGVMVMLARTLLSADRSKSTRSGFTIPRSLIDMSYDRVAEVIETLVRLRTGMSLESFGGPIRNAVLEPNLDVRRWGWRRAAGWADNWIVRHRARFESMRRHRVWMPRLSSDPNGTAYGCDEHGDYEVRELCSGWALFREGQTMQHCVGSYVQTCQSGRLAIASLRNAAQPIPAATFAVHIRSRRVVQIRGFRNRRVDAVAEHRIRSWAQTQRLDVEPNAW